MNVKIKTLLLLIALSSISYGQRVWSDNPREAKELQDARIACERRGHDVKFFLDKISPQEFVYLEDYPDSTIRVTEITGKVEEGVCVRCREKVTRNYPMREIRRERIWMDSTKLAIDSTGSIRRKR